MALHKKSGHGLDIEERLKNQLGITPEAPADADTDTDTHTHTYTHTDNNGYPYKKETKSKRLYLLAKPSVHQKLDEYAKAHDDTFNNLVHTLMEEFIDKHGL